VCFFLVERREGLEEVLDKYSCIRYSDLSRMTAGSRKAFPCMMDGCRITDSVPIYDLGIGQAPAFSISSMNKFLNLFEILEDEKMRKERSIRLEFGDSNSAGCASLPSSWTLGKDL
jgi:hypothetical protein